MQKTLSRKKNVLVGTCDNLVDNVWGQDRPVFKPESLKRMPDDISGEQFA